MRRRLLLFLIGLVAFIPVSVFAVDTLTVSFETYGGTQIPAVQKQWNRPFGELPVPVKEGVVFYGWYIDEDFRNEFTRNTLVLTDTVLYAKYIDAANVYKNLDIKIKMPKVGTVISKVDNSPITGGEGPDIAPEIELNPSTGLKAIGIIYDPQVGEYFYGTIEADKEYVLQVVVVIDDDNHLFADDINITHNFELYNDIKRVYPTDVMLGLSAYGTQEYSIVSGGDATFNGEDLIIKADGELRKLLGIKFDDKDLDKSNYETAEGSTILTLKASFLNTVKPGKHKVTFVYTDGEVDTYLTIPEPSKNPKTGDFIHIYTLLLMLSSIGLLTIRKRLN